MFTGLIENLGTVDQWQPSPNGGVLSIITENSWSDLGIGESIAVNGCCLTVISFQKNQIVFDVSDETLRKTTFHTLVQGTVVNLERALQVGARLGGHFVLGHVDDVGSIIKINQHAGSVEYRVKFPKNFANLLIEKGSVTVDGISLTVCDLGPEAFSVYIIPHTILKTNLAKAKEGSVVNLEFDVLGKYILRHNQIVDQ